MRIQPDLKYNGYPCSYVATGTAVNRILGIEIDLPDGLHDDGYLSLKSENKYIRSLLPIKKYDYYKRGERPKLKELLKNNQRKAVICVYGHLLYADKNNYYSFFDNDEDEVVAVWWIKEG